MWPSYVVNGCLQGAFTHAHTHVHFMDTNSHYCTLSCRVADSLGEENPKETREMKMFLQDIHSILRPKYVFANVDVDFTRMNGTQEQQNSIDCGLFALGHAEAFVREEDIAFTQDDIPVRRLRMLQLLAYSRASEVIQNASGRVSTEDMSDQNSILSQPINEALEPSEPEESDNDLEIMTPVDRLKMLLTGTRTCPSIRPWRSEFLSQPPKNWSNPMQSNFKILLQFLRERRCVLGVPVTNQMDAKNLQLQLRKDRGECAGEDNLTVHTLKVDRKQTVTECSEGCNGAGKVHIWLASIGKFSMPVWSERDLYWLLQHAKTRPHTLRGSVGVAQGYAREFSKESEMCSSKLLNAFLADHGLVLSAEWDACKAKAAQLKDVHASATVYTLSVDLRKHVVVSIDGFGKRPVWLAKVGDQVTGLWSSKPGDPNALVKEETGVEDARTAAKMRMEAIVLYTCKRYYLTQSDDKPNTPWTSHLPNSKLQILNANGQNFHLKRGFSPMDELNKIRAEVAAIPLEHFVDWSHVKILAPTLRKCIVKYEGCVDAPALHGQIEEVTEQELQSRQQKVIHAGKGTRLGDLLQGLGDRLRKLIPTYMLAKIKNPNKMYDVQINITTAPQPHHYDERRFDGPGGCIIVLYVDVGAMIVFAGKNDEEKAALFHRWIEAGDVYIFCGELRVRLDHGTYPTSIVAQDGRAKSVADADQSEKRTALTYRLGDPASEDETDEEDEENKPDTEDGKSKVY